MESSLNNDQTHIRFACEAVEHEHLQDGDNAGQATKLMMELRALISAPHKELGTVAF